MSMANNASVEKVKQYIHDGPASAQRRANVELFHMNQVRNVDHG